MIASEAFIGRLNAVFDSARPAAVALSGGVDSMAVRPPLRIAASNIASLGLRTGISSVLAARWIAVPKDEQVKRTASEPIMMSAQAPARPGRTIGITTSFQVRPIVAPVVRADSSSSGATCMSVPCSNLRP